MGSCTNAGKTIDCPACGARFDVARRPAGSRFRCGPCGLVLVVPVDAWSRDRTLGSVIGNRYRIIRKMGEVSDGPVYEARDIDHGHRTTFKMLLPHRANDCEHISRSLRGARTATGLSHPNIVGMYGVGYDSRYDVHFLAMEYVEGRTLRVILRDRGALDVRDAVHYVIQVCRGLAAVHERGIVHRNVHPGSLIVTADGAVKLLGFGLATVGDGDEAERPVVGTPHFMPPEQFHAKAKDGRSDIYALGATFYLMLTQALPHTGETPAKVLLSLMTNEPRSICDDRDDIPEGLWSIVRRMIHRDLDQRYARCEDVIRDLEAFRGDCEADIPEERAVAVLLDEAEAMARDAMFGDADARLDAAEERSPGNAAVAATRRDLEARRDTWREHLDALRASLGQSGSRAFADVLTKVGQEFSKRAELDLVEAAVWIPRAPRTPTAELVAAGKERAREFEEHGQIRLALMQWRGVLNHAGDDEEAKAAEKRLAPRTWDAEVLLREAKELLDAGDAGAAVERFREAWRLVPRDLLIGMELDEAHRSAERAAMKRNSD